MVDLNTVRFIIKGYEEIITKGVKLGCGRGAGGGWMVKNGP